MHILRLLWICGVASIGAGCATHPLPQDTTRRNTFQIVERLRCEARDAVIAALVKELRYRATKVEGSKRQQLLTLAKRIDDPNEPTFIVDFVDDYESKYQSLLPPRTQHLIERYRKSTIAMDFDFDITENDDNTIDVGFRDPSPMKLFTLGLAGGHKKRRQGERAFQVTFVFDALLRGKDEDAKDGRELAMQCAGENIKVPNFVYPIAGSIGLKETIQTFLDVADGVGYSNAKDFMDTLTFTTELYGNGDPKLMITSASKSFHIDGVSGTNKASRVDMHKVVVALALAKEREPEGGGETPLATTGTKVIRSKMRERIDAGAEETKAEALRILERARRLDFLSTQDEILRRLDELDE